MKKNKNSKKNEKSRKKTFQWGKMCNEVSEKWQVKLRYIALNNRQRVPSRDFCVKTANFTLKRLFFFLFSVCFHFFLFFFVFFSYSTFFFFLFSVFFFFFSYKWIENVKKTNYRSLTHKGHVKVAKSILGCYT